MCKASIFPLYYYFDPWSKLKLTQKSVVSVHGLDRHFSAFSPCKLGPQCNPPSRNLEPLLLVIQHLAHRPCGMVLILGPGMLHCWEIAEQAGAGHGGPASSLRANCESNKCSSLLFVPYWHLASGNIFLIYCICCI